MTNYILACTLVSVTVVQPLQAQSQMSADNEVQSFPAGGLRQSDVQDLGTYKSEVATWLTGAPNDSTGKKAKIYPQLQSWKESLDVLVSSQEQVDAFKMISPMAAIFSGTFAPETLADGLNIRSIECTIAAFTLFWQQVLISSSRMVTSIPQPSQSL